MHKNNLNTSFGMMLLLFALVLFGFQGCQSPLPTLPTETPLIVLIPSNTASANPSTTVSPSTAPTPTNPPISTNTPEPVGCLKPPDDYEKVLLNGYLFNQRTVAMLQHAANLYQGDIDILGSSITQGSFHDNGAASFGTHLGGGAVDLSVMLPGTYTVLYDQIPDLIQALRLAGFAAWLRDFDEVYPGSAIHIHAIAIGDLELSQPAEDQLTGKFGYFRGYNGLPIKNGPPALDRHGGPLICTWMLLAGYQDLRIPTVTPSPQLSPVN